jgi:sugar/nucleoside kinase (ribokinase family)
VRITALGDLLLDVIVQLDGPLVPGADRTARTHTGAGGQAANVAAWAAALGAEARFVTKRGGDAAGELVANELRGHGVELVGPVGDRTGVVVAIVDDGERTMASDRGCSPELRPDELDPSWFSCDALHLSGYALMREPIDGAALHAARIARAAGAGSVSIDLSSWTLIDGPFRERVRELAPDVVFAAEDERATFGELQTRWVVKRGAEGVVIDGEAFPAQPTDVVDPTGAGDAFAAGFLVGGVELGLTAAARCCAQLGTMP